MAWDRGQLRSSACIMLLAFNGWGGMGLVFLVFDRRRGVHDGVDLGR